MPLALEELTKEALSLPSHQRMALASFLLELDSPATSTSVDADWEREIVARIRAVDSGETVGVPYADVLREAERRVAQ